MRIVLLIFAFVLVIGGGVVGFLVYSGKIHFGAAKPQQRVAQVVPPGWTLVPCNTRQLPADTLITAELLVNPGTREIATKPVNLTELQGRGVMTEVTQVLGRVLRKDLRPGYVFAEADFYPKGTRPGIIAEIPPGKRAISLDATKISGARLLKRGDHVDLVASQAYDPSKKALAANPRLAAVRDPASFVKQAKVRVLAQDGVVISPVTVRQVPSQATKSHLMPVEEISIAVDSAEVIGVMEAIGAGAEMFCTIHSGRPEDPKNDNRIVPPAPPPDPVITVQAPPVATVERIVGRKHEFLNVPAAIVPVPRTQPAPGEPLGSAHQ